MYVLTKFTATSAYMGGRIWNGIHAPPPRVSPEITPGARPKPRCGGFAAQAVTVEPRELRKPFQKKLVGFRFDSAFCRPDMSSLRQDLHLLAMFLYPFWIKWIPSLEVTVLSAAIRSGRPAVTLQAVAQQESMTLKLVIPAFTNCFMSPFLIWIKPASRLLLKSLSCLLVQWPVSLQQLANRYRGRGGKMTHGLLPFSLITGITFSTSFLNASGGVVKTLPPRWCFPLLKNGNDEVPSNCSK